MTVVAVLARAPILGRVKTRLATEVGPERALEVYREIGRQVVYAVAAAHRVCIWHDPPEAADVMREWLGPDVELRPQPRGDLGDRLREAFACHFDRAEGPVIAIGTDAPDVDGTVVGAAERGLTETDVVLGPALDGGYYLIGLNEPRPELFRDVPWSTPHVLRITLDRCASLHIGMRLLEPLRDLDGVADLTALGLDQYS